MDNVYAIALRSADSHDGRYTVCVPPSVRYWYADPIVYELNGRTYLFAEQYDRFLKKGFLAAFEVLTKDGKISCTQPKRVISEAFHLSFPLIFTYENEHYLIPESCGDNSLRIYKMGKTAYEWELLRRIPMNDAVDTVLIPKDGRVFLINTEEHPTKKLYGKQKVYCMDSFPNGELNLISEEEEYSLTRRNGGPIFRDEEQNLIRVCQNCTESFYGKSFSLYEITELSEENGYADRQLSTIETDDLLLDISDGQFHLTGTHTYSKTEKYEAIDIFCNYYSVGNILAKLIRKFT